MAFERITIDHGKTGALPCIRDLHIPVSTVLGQLTAGHTTEQMLDNYPDLEREAVPAALEQAAAAVQEREIPFRRSVEPEREADDRSVTPEPSRSWCDGVSPAITEIARTCTQHACGLHDQRLGSPPHYAQ